MNRGDWQILLHIQVHCEDIAKFIERFGKDYDIFTEDRAYFNAVSMCILQIGELANSLSEEFRNETKDEMPWGMIRGMRNWLAHAYAETDESIIWETAINDIPSLLTFCNKVIDFNKDNFTEKVSIRKALKEIKAKPDLNDRKNRHKNNEYER